MAGLAGGCFQPVYGDRSVSGSPGVRESLKRVDVPVIQVPANSLLSPIVVQVRNELLFNFTGGAASTPPTHRLAIQLIGSQNTVAVDNTGYSQIENVRLNASFVLTEIATNKIVMVGQAATAAGYDGAGQQRFARVVAGQDAGRRAAKEISDQITTRVAAYFVSGS